MKESSDSKESQKQKILLKDYKKDAEFNEFLRMKIASKELALDVEPTPEEQRKLINEFNGWKKDGKKELKMPEIISIEDKVLKVYRVKHLGKQYIYYVDSKGVSHGMHWKHEYGKMINPETGIEEDDPKQITRSYPVYEQEYTKALGEELMKRAFDESEAPTFYLKYGKNKKVSVTDINHFNEDFDELVNKHNNKQVI